LDMNKGSTQVLGALSNNSTYQPNAANQEYCVPGDTTSCAAPVGEWKLDENTGNTAYDSSGNGGNMIANLGVFIPYAKGMFGSALQNTAPVTGIGVADTAPLSITGNFTISAWINLQDTSGGSIFSKAGSTCTTNGYTFRIDSPGLLRLRTCDASTSTDVTDTNTTLSTNTWYFVTAVYDGSNAIIYLNGRRDFSGANTRNPTDGGGAVSAGSHIGKTDLIRVYNYVRTPAQIAWEYNRGGPVGWWKMDECSGTTLYDASGTNANNGTWSGSGAGNTSAGNCTTVDTATAWYNGRTGKFNGSLDFDGANAAGDDNVSITNASSIDLNENLATAHTFATWVYVNSDGESDLGHIYGKDDTAPPETYLRVAGESGGRVNVAAGLDLATTDSTVSVSSAIATGTWNHIAVTYTDDADDEIELYINGALAGTGSGGNGTPNTDASNLIIGNSAAGTRTCDCQIDDFRIYNYALNTTQLKTIMNQGAATRFGPSTGSP
jgi:hypothetical protein